MTQVNIYARFSDWNQGAEKIATLTEDHHLIYNDESLLPTMCKFTLLTAASPLIALARLVRSAVFLFSEGAHRAGKEFIGALTTPIVTAALLTGTLLSGAIFVLTFGKTSLYTAMRRTYASFEAWVNGIDLKARDLPSLSHRVSNPHDFIGNENHIWTTAPCMQPVLEKGRSEQGGLLDLNRMRKIFPFLKINRIANEEGRIMVESEYENKNEYFTACGGMIEHTRIENDCCCYFRVKAAYDRVLCCAVEKGNCHSILDPGNSCGYVGCYIGCVGACCCYTKEQNEMTSLNTGCWGPLGLYPMNIFTKHTRAV